MKSAKVFIVPHWTKVVFFWFAAALVVWVLGYQINKRLTYRRLYLDNLIGASSVAPVSAPDFHLSGISLRQFAGKWVLLNFWATWCPPCRKEMPSLEQLSGHFQDRLTVVTVSVDDDYNQVRQFFKQRQPLFHVAWDKEKAASRAFGVGKYPETFLISPSQKIVARFSGPREWYGKEAITYFDDVLAGKRY